MDEKIADCAIRHYDNVLHPTKGKPKDSEWTVYAAIVAQEEKYNDNLWVVSCATGTKCSTFVPPNEMCTETTSNVEKMVLRDCHAETLARRGLMRVLWTEIDRHVEDNTKCVSAPTQQRKLLEPEEKEEEECQVGTAKFRLRSDIKLHLFVSDSLCGDASIYPLKETFPEKVRKVDTKATAQRMNTNAIINFTGAKVIVSEKTGVEVSACGGDHQLLSTGSKSVRNARPLLQDDELINASTVITVAREDTQLLGKLRTKSGRSNLPEHMRSSCMSCSDKLVRWNVLGLQGALLSRYVPNPIRLSSIVISHDPRALSRQAQRDALCRATQERIVSTLVSLKSALAREKTPLVSATKIYLQDDSRLSVHIVSKTFARGKSMMELERFQQPFSTTSYETKKKRKRATISPCGISLCWDVVLAESQKQSGDMPLEQIVGARGFCQGKKPTHIEDYSRVASRLSRNAFAGLARSVYTKMKSLNTSETQKLPRAVDVSFSDLRYEHVKKTHENAALQKLRSIIFSSGPLAGWLTSK